jgi:hypothetical protein
MALNHLAGNGGAAYLISFLTVSAKLFPSRAMSAKAPQRFVHVQNIGRGHHTWSHGPTILILNFLHMGFPPLQKAIMRKRCVKILNRRVRSLDKFMKIFEKITWSLSYV